MKCEMEMTPQLIKAERLALKLSQEELAQKIGVTFSTVNRWENGKTIPSKLAMNQLSRLFSTRRSSKASFAKKSSSPKAR